MAMIGMQLYYLNQDISIENKMLRVHIPSFKINETTQNYWAHSLVLMNNYEVSKLGTPSLSLWYRKFDLLPAGFCFIEMSRYCPN